MLRALAPRTIPGFCQTEDCVSHQRKHNTEKRSIPIFIISRAGCFNTTFHVVRRLQQFVANITSRLVGGNATRR